MFRYSLVLLGALALARPAPAATWAEAMFEELARDFGTVPRGPMLTHPFRLTNTTGQKLHISTIRVSCGCVSAMAFRAEVAPGESTVILAQMDSRRFLGAKQVTIFVQFDAPAREEVRLSVQAYGRDDLTLTPESIAFGQVKRNEGATQRVVVSFVGDPNWQVTEVTSQSGYVRPKVKELRRTQSEVAYELTAELQPGLPAGNWFTDIWMKTTDAGTPRLRVPVTVEVESALSLSPGSAQFGSVNVGGKAERKLLLKGVKPFRVVDVKGGNAEVSAREVGGAEAKVVHVLAVTLQPTAAGAMRKTLKVVTDLTEDSTVDLPVEALVEPQE